MCVQTAAQLAALGLEAGVEEPCGISGRGAIGKARGIAPAQSVDENRRIAEVARLDLG